MSNSEDYILTDSDVVQLLDAWCLENPHIQPTSQGTVNTTFFVDTLQSKFIFKLYDDSTTTPQIKYEHSLLAHLQSCDLCFTVPKPIPDSSGETLLAVKRNNCEQDLCKRDKTLVVRDTIKLITKFKIDKSVTAPYKLNNELRFTLQKYISGESANRQDINHIYASGKALGELHRSLAEFDSQGKLAQLPSWGELDRIHPLIIDPLEVPQLLNLEQQQQLEEILEEVIETTPALYKQLPLQTTHADYLCPNILIEDNRVVGIIDFEFATYDLRLLDFVAALDHFSRIGNEVPVWERIEAFINGYKKYIDFLKLEIEALTSIWRLQQANCIVYWTGWLLEGKVTYESVLNAVTKNFLLEDWFKVNDSKLLKYLAVKTATTQAKSTCVDY